MRGKTLKKDIKWKKSGNCFLPGGSKWGWIYIRHRRRANQAAFRTIVEVVCCVTRLGAGTPHHGPSGPKSWSLWSLWAGRTTCDPKKSFSRILLSVFTSHGCSDPFLLLADDPIRFYFSRMILSVFTSRGWSYPFLSTVMQTFGHSPLDQQLRQSYNLNKNSV